MSSERTWESNQCISPLSARRPCDESCNKNWQLDFSHWKFEERCQFVVVWGFTEKRKDGRQLLHTQRAYSVQVRHHTSAQLRVGHRIQRQGHFHLGEEVLDEDAVLPVDCRELHERTVRTLLQTLQDGQEALQEHFFLVRHFYLLRLFRLLIIINTILTSVFYIIIILIWRVWVFWVGIIRDNNADRVLVIVAISWGVLVFFWQNS